MAALWQNEVNPCARTAPTDIVVNRQLIGESELDQLYITDSIGGVSASEKIQPLTLTTLLANAIGVYPTNHLVMFL